ncbi:hypothetical protein [Draconibacterium halophilum]|uniref:Bacteriocin n=1 Tax=Draconibacterium halophilum TaxID=2706887 RepID=A0A6C0RFZ4_9BACT|nr:hypothetical protein [Draconibacterium halophilum]QIA08443.1 hypothetical protein G0Q07_12295 [Draconibacterium halophilum]
MNVIASFFTENNGDFELLSEEAMNEVRGGGTPKSRDKDIYDFEEE